jgi:hypothetical protein
VLFLPWRVIFEKMADSLCTYPPKKEKLIVRINWITVN